MTCIVGYVHKDEVHIGGDSAGVDGGFRIQIRKDPKVFKQGPFIMGFTSSFRMGQILMSSKFEITKQKKDQSDYDYMITEFVDAARECFKKGGYLQKYDEGDEKGGTFLVGYKGVLYYIEDDFQVGISEENYGACGCGSELAKGALFALKETEILYQAQKKITIALDSASRFSAGVAPPYNFVSMSLGESEKEASKLKVIRKVKKFKKTEK